MAADPPVPADQSGPTPAAPTATSTTTTGPIPTGPSVTGPIQTAPIVLGQSTDPFRPGGPVRRVLRRWSFPIFVLVVAYLGRNVLLPFVFAALVAYILAPVIRWMAERKDGTRRMPRGLAIIICYLAFIGAIVGFCMLFLPRLYGDLSRIGKEAPALYQRANEQWIPSVAHRLEKRFPSLASTDNIKPEIAPLVPDVPLPPGTAFVLTPLPDGTYAVQVTPSGVLLKQEPSGGWRLIPSEQPPEPQTLEEKMRSYLGKAMAGLQSQADDLARFGQALVTAVVKGIFTFFLVLMIGAFMLIDMEKVHAFMRRLFPPDVRDDYDVIVAGIDRGLSGVIRGQLLICLINGVFTYIGLLIFDVKYPIILAFVAAAMSLIPIFGSILSTVPIVLVALVSGDEGIDIARGVAMIAWIVGIHFVEANFLNPKIIGTAAKIHPVLVIFSLILGEKSYGLIGALFAVPVLSIVSVLFLFFYRKTWKQGLPVTPPSSSS